MRIKDKIAQKLQQHLTVLSIRIVDQSHLHAGHAGARPGGESHFLLELVAEEFTELTRLERQRLVHSILAEELRGPVHALALRLKAPME